MSNWHNQVTGEELVNYINGWELDLVAHLGERYDAEITYHMGTRMFRVYDHRKLILSATSAEVAAEVYNQIRPRP